MENRFLNNDKFTDENFGKTEIGKDKYYDERAENNSKKIIIYIFIVSLMIISYYIFSKYYFVPVQEILPK
jgi:hypothetical protein